MELAELHENYLKAVHTGHKVSWCTTGTSAWGHPPALLPALGISTKQLACLPASRVADNEIWHHQLLGHVPLDQAGTSCTLAPSHRMLIPAAAVLQAKERNLAIGKSPCMLPTSPAFSHQ